MQAMQNHIKTKDTYMYSFHNVMTHARTHKHAPPPTHKTVGLKLIFGDLNIYTVFVQLMLIASIAAV